MNLQKITNMNIDRIGRHSSALALVTCFILLTAGCSPQQTASEPEQETPAAPEQTAERAQEPAAQSEYVNENTVQVSLTEFKIDMPSTLPPGPTAFKIKNDGNLVHNLEIEGQGIEKELPEDLQAGESGTLQVDLKPGTYHVYCPVGNHEAQGMAMQLKVEEK